MTSPPRTPVTSARPLPQILLTPPAARAPDLSLHIQQQVLNATRFAASQPDNEVLWSQLRLTVGNLLQDLFRQGAFAGTNPAEAYSVRCDASTNTQTDIALGVVQILIGFAASVPAEFTVLHITIQAQPA